MGRPRAGCCTQSAALPTGRRTWMPRLSVTTAGFLWLAATQSAAGGSGGWRGVGQGRGGEVGTSIAATACHLLARAPLPLPPCPRSPSPATVSLMVPLPVQSRMRTDTTCASLATPTCSPIAVPATCVPAGEGGGGGGGVAQGERSCQRGVEAQWAVVSRSLHVPVLPAARPATPCSMPPPHTGPPHHARRSPQRWRPPLQSHSLCGEQRGREGVLSTVGGPGRGSQWRCQPARGPAAAPPAP